MSYQILDVRGARLTMYITKDTVLNKAVTLTDSNGEAIDLSSYTNFIYRIFTTPADTEFSEADGDITQAANVVTFNFEVTLTAATYDYQFVGVTAVGETELLRGELKVYDSH